MHEVSRLVRAMVRSRDRYFALLAKHPEGYPMQLQTEDSEESTAEDAAVSLCLGNT